MKTITPNLCYFTQKTKFSDFFKCSLEKKGLILVIMVHKIQKISHTYLQCMPHPLGYPDQCSLRQGLYSDEYLRTKRDAPSIPDIHKQVCIAYLTTI